MSLLYREKEKLCVLAKVEAKYEGRGKAAGKKKSVILSYQVYENHDEITVTDRIDFWNNRDPAKLQLRDRIEKVKVGDDIVVVISTKDKDHTALQFVSGAGTLTFTGEHGEINIIAGYAGTYTEHDVVVGDGKKYHVGRVGIPLGTGNETEWKNLSFWDTPSRPKTTYFAKKAISDAKSNRNMVVAVCGKKSEIRQSKDGSMSAAYNGWTIHVFWKRNLTSGKDASTSVTGQDIKPDIGNPTSAPIQQQSKPSPTPTKIFTVTIGPYRKAPVNLYQIFDGTTKERTQNILDWLEFVSSDLYKPLNESELLQKREIAKFYKSLNR